MTSFGGRDLITRHRHDYERRKRAHYLPIDPSPAHPDAPDKNVVLKLGGGAVLRKNSWVNTETQYRVVLSLLRNYEWRTGKLFMLMPESYARLMDFVGFRADEVVAGPSMSVGMSETPEPEAGPTVTQTPTPPLTPERRPVVVPELVPGPVARLPEVVEPAMAHDSDSDTTIVAEDYWEADMRHRRDQVFNQRFTITREGNHGSNPSVFMGAHRASYATSASEQRRQQPHLPVSPNVPTAPSRSELLWVLRQANNERSSLLRPQTQATAPNPQAKSQVPAPATRTGYGTIPSSSRPPQIHTPRAQGQAHSRIQDPLTAAATARARARALAAAELPMLERKRPKHTWFSRLGLPFRFDFVFFGTSATNARARARAYGEVIAVARTQAGMDRGPRVGGVGGRRPAQYEGMITRAEARAVERELNAGPAFEYARLAPSDVEGEGKEKGRLSMLAKGVLVFVVLLVQATLLAAVVWGFVHLSADKAIVEWVARAAGKVVGAWEVCVWAFWKVVDFLEFLVQLILGLLCWGFIIACLASCCGCCG